MVENTINLRRARKIRARDLRREEADATTLNAGLSKKAKQQITSIATLQRQKHDDHKLDE